MNCLHSTLSVLWGLLSQPTCTYYVPFVITMWDFTGCIQLFQGCVAINHHLYISNLFCKWRSGISPVATLFLSKIVSRAYFSYFLAWNVFPPLSVLCFPCHIPGEITQHQCPRTMDMTEKI
jgi:hypothetical protein